MQIKSSLRQLQAALEHSADAIFVTDAESTIQWVNEAFEQTTGYSRDEVIGKTPAILRSGQNSDSLYRAMWATLARGESWSGEFMNRRKDGTVYTDQMTISPIRDDADQIIEYVAVARDTSQSKRAAHALRTALEEAERTNAFQRRLLDNLSHQVHTPLAAIIGYSEVLASEASNHHREFARNIKRSGQRLLDTLDRLLELSSLESGITRYEPRWFNPKRVCEMLVEDFQADARDRGVSLSAEFAPEVPLKLYQDPALLDRALHHIIENALQFTPKGDITLGVAGNSQHLEFFVRDTGMGMLPRAVRVALEDFTQGEDDKTGNSLGIGMSIVRRIADLLDMRIQIDSQLGRGTTVSLRVTSPVTWAADGQHVPAPERAARDLPPTQPLGRRHTATR